MAISTGVEPPGRIAFLDALRGYALLGLFLVHCVEMFEIVWLGEPFGNTTFDWTFHIFGGKAYAIFAMLFGVSFYLILEGGRRRDENVSGRFLWRISLLFIFGLIHGLLYSGDILQILALSGLILWLLYRLPLWSIFLIAAVILLQLPFLVTGLYWEGVQLAPFDDAVSKARSQLVLTTYQSGSFIELLQVNSWEGFVRKWSWFYHFGRLFNVLGLTLLGYGLARIAFFQNQKTNLKLYRTILAYSISIVIFLEMFRQNILGLFSFEYAGVYLSTAYSTIINNLYTFITVIVALLLFRLSATRKLLLSLAPAGRMSLTVYLGQSLICIPIFYGFGFSGWQWLGSETALLLGIALWLPLMYGCHVWMLKFRYGPAEWFWRACTVRNFKLSIRAGSY